MDWKNNFEVDGMGSVRCVNAATEALNASDAASVIFIGSTAAVETFIGPTSYNAVKAALVTHSNGLAQALATKLATSTTLIPWSGADLRAFPPMDRLAYWPLESCEW